MAIGTRFDFPDSQHPKRKRMVILSWITIAALITTAIAMYVTLGQSQAMKTAWAEDLLGMIPPISLLVALRFENRAPTRRFPYGYFRAISAAFLAAAATLSTIGLWLFANAVMNLLMKERPPVGTFEIFGHHFWLGWAMIVALVYATILSVTLGTLKRPLARDLNDKVLEADADMNKADWTSQGAAIAGILLVGYGYWWGDSLAAALISLSILHDGWRNLRQVIGDLMDESPSKLGHSHALEDVPEKLHRAAEQLPWVAAAAVRLREQGHVLTGEVFVVPRDGAQLSARDLVERTLRASDELRKVDWRLHCLSIVPVPHLDQQTPPRIEAPAA